MKRDGYRKKYKTSEGSTSFYNKWCLLEAGALFAVRCMYRESGKTCMDDIACGNKYRYMCQKLKAGNFLED